MIPDNQLEEDTIPVREDEKFDIQTVEEYLEGKIPGFDGSNDLKVRQFWGGAANLTYELTYGDHEYVLRRPPLGPVAKSAHDMSREYRVLSVLYERFPLAPRAYHLCEDKDIIGAPFFIMERKHGVVIRRSVPEAFQDDPDAAEECSKALVDALVDFHKVNYKDLGLSDLGRPEGFIERQVEGWYKRWNKAKLEDNPQMDQVYEWLKDNLPESNNYSLVHNDYKLDNVMFDKNDPGKIKAVFDWDMCTLGDPMSDLGALLTYWYQPDDPEYLKQVAMMPTEDHGFMTRPEIIDRYAKKSGMSVDNINFYHTLGLFRLVVIIAQIYIRYVKGQTQDERFAGLGKIMPYIIRAAHEVSQGTFKSN